MTTMNKFFMNKYSQRYIVLFVNKVYTSKIFLACFCIISNSLYKSLLNWIHQKKSILKIFTFVTFWCLAICVCETQRTCEIKCNQFKFTFWTTSRFGSWLWQLAVDWGDRGSVRANLWHQDLDKSNHLTLWLPQSGLMTVQITWTKDLI